MEKPKIPSTLSQAVKENLRVEDLKNLLESSQVRFPDSPLLWVRDVAAYLNLKLVTQPAVEGDILGGEPCTALTANMKKVINVMLQKCSDSMKETFFETCVANTAHDLSKGSKVVPSQVESNHPMSRSVCVWLEDPDPATGRDQPHPCNSSYQQIYRAEEQLSEQASCGPLYSVVYRPGRK